MGEIREPQAHGRLRHRQAHPFRPVRFVPVLLIPFLALAACAADSTPATARNPAVPTMQEPLITHRDETGYTYSNKPVLSKLGPHRFMIPANYFRDQIGPDFQGGMLMVMMWPTLDAAAPGHLREMTIIEQAHMVEFNLDYIADKVPVQESMDGSDRSYSDDPIKQQDPLDNIAYRTRGEDRFGLEYWVVSDADKARYLKLIEGKRDRYSWPVNPDWVEDWYLRRDAQGHLLTFIKCTPASMPDGLVIRGNTLDFGGTPSPRASCDHHFVLPEYGTNIHVSYPRVLLKDWARIETRFRELMTRSYLGDESQGSRSKR